MQPSLGGDLAVRTRTRLTILALLVVSLFIVLFARLWFLQVMVGEGFVEAAVGNTVRTLTLPAPRGKILDRNGEPIVTNRFARVISVQTLEMGDRRDEVLDDLADLLSLSREELDATIEENRLGAFRPTPVAIDPPEDVEFYVHENRSTRYPGVYLETLPIRDYPEGTRAAHLVGYLGEISRDELDLPEYARYRAGDVIGWSGVERTYESRLRGTDGSRRLAVDARDRLIGEIALEPPTPGEDVHLTIDVRAQELVEQALDEGIAVARRAQDAGSGPGRGGTYAAPAGAAVVLDTATGEVIAMASYPTFAPAEFVGGISSSQWARLQDPDSAFPLINRPVQASYPPGSVFKVVTAGVALMEGYLRPMDRLGCPAVWIWNEFEYPNWRTTDAPFMNLAEALEDSCNTVFYELARQMFNDEVREISQEGEVRERLPDAARSWGFGDRLGIDLPSERRGVIPGREWKRDYWETHRDTYCTKARTLTPGTWAQELNDELCDHGFRWRGGDAANMSIGQGDVQTTPLQMASAYAAIANGGERMRPHVVREIVGPEGEREVMEPEPLGQLPVRPQDLAVIREGLERVTGPNGTAGATFTTLPAHVGGKTGTAEDRPRQPIAWFASYAPADDPQYAVVTMIEAGGSGSLTAAPIARRIIEGLLDLPETEIVPGQEAD